MDEVEVVVAHHERATLRVGDVFPKIDADQARRRRGSGDGDRADVDLHVIRAWWSLRSLHAVRWLMDHGFDPCQPGCEVNVLRSRV